MKRKFGGSDYSPEEAMKLAKKYADLVEIRELVVDLTGQQRKADILEDFRQLSLLKEKTVCPPRLKRGLAGPKQEVIDRLWEDLIKDVLDRFQHCNSLEEVSLLADGLNLPGWGEEGLKWFQPRKIYIIQSEWHYLNGLVKVGASQDPEKRYPRDWKTFRRTSILTSPFKADAEVHAILRENFSLSKEHGKETYEASFEDVENLLNKFLDEHLTLQNQ